MSIPKKIKLPKHYLCFTDGTKAVMAAKADTLKAAKEYAGYFHAEEIPADQHKRGGLVYGIALRLNQRHKELLESVEAALMIDIANHALFSDFATIEDWMNAHGIRQSAAAISRARSLAEVIVPWCADNDVLGEHRTQREVEQWFLSLNEEARTTVNRVGHVAPIIKKIVKDEEMPQPDKVKAVQDILGLVANPKIPNEDLMLFGRKHYFDKAVGTRRLRPDGKIEVTLTLESEDHFEYIKEHRLKSFVAWE